MIADYFWKVIFLVLLIIGLNYWFDWRDEVNSYNRHLNALAEILEKPTRKGDKACRTATFQSMFHLHKIENSYDEFKSLVLSSGTNIFKEIKIRQNSPTISTFISKGKLELLKDIVSRSDIELVIVNHSLSASQARNLEKILGKRI